MKKFYIYALYSESHNQFYIGHTDNIERRFEQHNKGRVNSTKPYRPFKIIYVEVANSKDNAVKRERQLKLTEGRRFLKRFI